MQVSRGVVVVSIQVDLDDDVIARFREDLLSRLHQTGLRAVILDVSGLEILDPSELTQLRRIISMTELMGARSILVGLRPGVVSALVSADAEIDGIEAAIDLDAAFDKLEPMLASEQGEEPEDAEENEEDPIDPPALAAEVER